MNLRATLQRLADAAGRYICDYAEASPDVRAEIRRNLGGAQTDACDVLYLRDGDLRDVYDTDPLALEWARAKVEHEIVRAREMQRQGAEIGIDATLWANYEHLLRDALIGGEGCVVAAFDRRLPDLIPAIRP